MNIDISIIIPVYNSEKYLQVLVNRIVDSLNQLNKTYEIVFVDDCSKDNSWFELQKIHKHHDNIIIIQLTRNFGEHNAVIAGLNNCSGKYVIIMDDDGQNPPEELHKLISSAEENNSDVVYTYYEVKKHSFFRNIGSIFANYCATLVLDKPKDLYLSSFKLIHRDIVKNIIDYKGPYTYIDGLLFYFTKKISKIKVDHSARQIGKSSYNIRKLVSLWLKIILNYSTIPLRLSFVFGLIILGIVTVFSIVVLVEKMFFNPTIPIGYTSIILLISLVSSFQFIIIGILGEYIGRLFMQMSNKPQFAIRFLYD